MTFLFSILWLLCCYLLACLLAGPSLWLLFHCINTQDLATFVMGMPLSMLAGLFLTFITTTLFYTLLPNYKPGNHRLFTDSGAILWAINNAPATLLLKWLQSTLFLNDPLRFLMLKALGCHTHYSTWISSNVHLSDLRHIHIGRNTLIGEMSFLSPSIQTRRNKLKVAPIRIGDNVMIGYKSEIGPGTTIANDCQIQSRVTLTINVNIGENSIIGAGSVLLPNVRIGKRVKIGTGCVIHRGSVVPDHAVVGDGEVVFADA